MGELSKRVGSQLKGLLNDKLEVQRVLIDHERTASVASIASDRASRMIKKVDRDIKATRMMKSDFFRTR
jgi:hypothetical protein